LSKSWVYIGFRKNWFQGNLTIAHLGFSNPSSPLGHVLKDEPCDSLFKFDKKEMINSHSTDFFWSYFIVTKF